MNKYWFGVLAACVTGTCAAQPHLGDVVLTVEGNQITTHSELGPDRVFASEFEAVTPPSTLEPGFDCEPGTFPAGSRVGFRILDALRVWNGADFLTVAPSRLEVAFSTLSTLTPETPGVVEGFTLLVASNGQWHRHFEFTLQSPGDTGLYLLSFQLFSDAGIADSQPFWIVFNNAAATTEFERAVQWVRDNLLPPACDPDVNCDGAVNGFDVEAMERAVNGDLADFCQPDPDFNRDGAVNGFDVEAVEQATNGAPCP